MGEEGEDVGQVALNHAGGLDLGEPLRVLLGQILLSVEPEVLRIVPEVLNRYTQPYPAVKWHPPGPRPRRSPGLGALRRSADTAGARFGAGRAGGASSATAACSVQSQPAQPSDRSLAP